MGITTTFETSSDCNSVLYDYFLEGIILQLLLKQVVIVTTSFWIAEYMVILQLLLKQVVIVTLNLARFYKISLITTTFETSSDCNVGLTDTTERGSNYNYF